VSSDLIVSSGSIQTNNGRFVSVQDVGGIDTHFRASRGGTVWQLQTLASDEFNIEVGGGDALTIDSSQNAAFAGQVNLAASTTARPSLNIPSGTAPTSPTNGDIWSDGSDLLVRLGGTTYTLTKA